MHIGVDATCWQNNRGYGRHARALLSSLVRADRENRYTFVMDSASGIDGVPTEANVRLVRASAPTAVAASSNGHRSVLDVWRVSRVLSEPSFDLLLFPTVYSFVPAFGRAKKLVMIHDVIAEKYPRLTLPSVTARLLWRTKVDLACRQANAIATVSEYSRLSLLEHFRLPPERVFVVGEASDPIFRVMENPQPTPRLCSLGISSRGRVVVYVGGFGPHKNLKTLVSVFAHLAAQSEFSDVRLVLVGEHRNEVFHSCFTAVEAQVSTLGLSERVVFTGYLPDHELVVLLNLSSVLVLPSLMEGFGLPAVEAAACGCPVIATTASPLPQLLGDGGIYVDPMRSEEMVAALTRVLRSEQLRERMREAGIAAARRLSWESAARQMMGVIREVAGR